MHHSRFFFFKVHIFSTTHPSLKSSLHHTLYYHPMLLFYWMLKTLGWYHFLLLSSSLWFQMATNESDPAYLYSATLYQACYEGKLKTSQDLVLIGALVSFRPHFVANWHFKQILTGHHIFTLRPSMDILKLSVGYCSLVVWRWGGARIPIENLATSWWFRQYRGFLQW